MNATLSESKQTMLQRRVQAARAAVGVPAETTIPRTSGSGPRALAFMQQQLWFLDRLVPGCPAYNVFEAVRIRGEGLSIPALERAFTEIVRRHEVLRTTFTVESGTPLVSPPAAFRLEVEDLRGVEASLRAARAFELARAEAQKPFDLSRDLLLRARLLRLADDEHLLLVNMHHIASDGWSLGVLYKELSAAYQSETLPPLPIQFSDYAAWQRRTVTGDKQIEYWKAKLAGAPDVLQIPCDHPRPARPTFRGALESFTVPSAVLESLKKLAREENGTLFMVLAAAFKTLLHRYTGHTDIVVGSTIAGRNQWETESLIGPFINALPLRSDLSGDPSFRELLRQVRGTLLEAWANQDVALELIVQEVRPKRSVPHLPLFQTMLIMQSVPTHGFDVPGFISERTEVDNGTAKFDLTLSMTETAEGLATTCEYSTDLFEAATIRRLIEHFQTLLRGVAEGPDRALSRLPLMTDGERRQVLVDWNQTYSPYPENETVIDLFAEQVARAPNKMALRSGATQLTYKELDERATRLAGFLAERGVGPEVLVGVCMQRSVELAVALLGILKAGGAYVPMDPAYPEERLEYMAKDSKLSLVLTDDATDAAISFAPTLCVTRLDLAIFARRSETTARSARRGRGRRTSTSHFSTTPGNLAYVIYTSGSTGSPKGVAVEHRSLNAFLHWARERFSDEELDGVLFATSVCFDLSVFELFAPLCWGGKVILASNGIDWLSLPEADEVTLVNTVPSVAKEWLRIGSLPPRVRTINLAGEPLAQDTVEQLYRRFPQVKRVYDLYGPTEDTVYSTCALRRPGGETTIGRPLSNKRIYLLDAHQEPVPIGLPGELHIGGAGLARGYLHRPELTTERFLPNPFDPSERLYKTGDLARYRGDGQIEFLGRADHQVKVRGFRIELGEIEAQLRRHPAVAEAAVVAIDEASDKRLVAYLVFKNDAEAGDLRSFLRKSLPDYMMPAAFTRLGAFPLTPNGKVDRKALPLAASQDSEVMVAGKPPRTPTEERLVEIWREVLKAPRIAVDHDFFSLGGHSILAMQVMARVRETFQCDLPVRHLFESPTIAELGAAIEGKLREEIAELSDDEAEELINERRNVP